MAFQLISKKREVDPILDELIFRDCRQKTTVRCSRCSNCKFISETQDHVCTVLCKNNTISGDIRELSYFSENCPAFNEDLLFFF